MSKLIINYKIIFPTNKKKKCFTHILLVLCKKNKFYQTLYKYMYFNGGALLPYIMLYYYLHRRQYNHSHCSNKYE